MFVCNPIFDIFFAIQITHTTTINTLSYVLQQHVYLGYVGTVSISAGTPTFMFNLQIIQDEYASSFLQSFLKKNYG